MADPEDHLRGDKKEAAESCSQAAATQRPPGRPKCVAASRERAGPGPTERVRAPRGAPTAGPREAQAGSPGPGGAVLTCSPRVKVAVRGAGAQAQSGTASFHIRPGSAPARSPAPPLATRRPTASPTQSRADGSAPRRGVANRGSAPIHPPAPAAGAVSAAPPAPSLRSASALPGGSSRAAGAAASPAAEGAWGGGCGPLGLLPGSHSPPCPSPSGRGAPLPGGP